MAGDAGTVILTDDCKTARQLQAKHAVIGITGPMPEYELWHGVSWLAEEVSGVDEEYVQLVWSRFAKVPLIVAESERIIIREMKPEDAEEILSLYHGEGNQFVAAPTKDAKEMQEIIRAYQREICERGFPGMWVIESRDGRLLGRAGAENGELGYLIAPQYRRRGIAEEACRLIISYMERNHPEEMLMIRTDENNIAAIALAKKLGFYAKDPVFLPQLSLCVE